MKKSIVAVIALFALLMSMLCACKKDDGKTGADTTGDAQTSAAGDVVDDTTALPEDSTAQEGETNETQSADPAKPGETASNQVTAAPSKNAKDWTKAEIIAYFNAGANRVKYQAKSVTRNYTETKNDADKTELPKAIDAIGKSAMKTFMKRDDKAIVLTSKEDIRNVFPVGGKDWVSKLTPADVKGAKVEDKGGEHQITLTLGTEVNPSGEKGYAAASMDELTASVGLTRGALYHNFNDKKGLLAAVVAQIDSEMAANAKAIAAAAEDDWERLLAEGIAYIKMALVPEVQRIVLLDGPAVLGDPAQWPSQNNCLESTRQTIEKMMECNVIKKMDARVAAHLLNGAALNAALLIAASDEPQKTLPHAIEVFTLLASGLRNG